MEETVGTRQARMTGGMMIASVEAPVSHQPRNAGLGSGPHGRRARLPTIPCHRRRRRRIRLCTTGEMLTKHMRLAVKGADLPGPLKKWDGMIAGIGFCAIARVTCELSARSCAKHRPLFKYRFLKTLCFELTATKIGGCDVQQKNRCPLCAPCSEKKHASLELPALPPSQI